MMKRYLLIPFCLLFMVCAKQGFPPGGPEDKTPPEVIRTFPETGAVRVDRSTDVQIWFSESVRHGTATDAVFITPNPEGEVRVKWRSKGLKIRFSEPLLEARTYVITLGTDIRDYRNNALAESFILAFSTGDSLDQGKITGRVTGPEKTAGIGVWAYAMQDNIDPDPTSTEPDYIVQCGENGDFAFSHLAEHQYRLFAVRDRVADRLYRPVEDEIGLTCKDIDLSVLPGHQGGPVLFRMFREDTLAPRLVRASATHASRISVQLNEPFILTDTVRVEILPDSTGSVPDFKITGFYQDPEVRQWLHLITEPQPREASFLIRVQGVQDEAGYPVDPDFSVVPFTSTMTPDTTVPELVLVRPGNRARHVPVHPKIEILFTEAMDSASWADRVTLKDTAEVAVSLVMSSMEYARWLIEPVHDLESEAVYHLRLDSLLTDLSGNCLADTLLHFTTLNRDTLSEISGRVTDSDSGAHGPIHMTLQGTDRDARVYRISEQKPGDYQFTNIFPGLYLLEAYRDEDRSDDYTHGCPYPFIPAERFFIFPDTIKARSRWNNAGNDFSLP